MTPNQDPDGLGGRNIRPSELNLMLDCAVKGAREAGALMRKNVHLKKKISLEQKHDIKLELDVRCQKAIENVLRSSFPKFAILGEEGVSGDENAPVRWVVDPIDGTVNFSYGIPHACVSVALQIRSDVARSLKSNARQKDYETALGVVYDPFCGELWTALRGHPARLNGKVIHASRRCKLGEAIVSVGFAKQAKSLGQMLPVFDQLAGHARKIRIMGSAALGLVYVASGRFDAYIESDIRLWDIAAGGLILECAGGEFSRWPVADGSYYRVIASNGRLSRQLYRRCPRLRKICQESEITANRRPGLSRPRCRKL